MDRRNILSEAKITDIFKIFKFFNILKRKKLSTSEKNLLKQKNILGAIKDLESDMRKTRSKIEKYAKDAGVDVDDFYKGFR
tara:strand:- start:74 stop:316 length:243 start_codon:yes stop_codon:yes gene_type:complete